ncbi:MAG: hypothetical protein II200_08820, partial [Bacteroidaceae bacterium]|nr:hypothetical protein [Bacteroidaceae bacterium]
TVKKTIQTTLSTELEPIKKDIKSLQNSEVNFSTRLQPLQEEIDHLKDDITEILADLKSKGVDLSNICEREQLLEHETRCAWRYRIRFAPFAKIYIDNKYSSYLQNHFAPRTTNV